VETTQHYIKIWSDFDRASSLICGNKMSTIYNNVFYCRSYNLLNMFRAPLCPSSEAREYYTVGCRLWSLVLSFQVVGMVWSWGLCVRFAGCSLYFKHNETHTTPFQREQRHHGICLRLLFQKKVFYLTMLSAIKRVASMADERNMSLGHWWKKFFPVPLSPTQNPLSTGRG
jgi:hypothetical protein